eukprot:217119_1
MGKVNDLPFTIVHQKKKTMNASNFCSNCGNSLKQVVQNNNNNGMAKIHNPYAPNNNNGMAKVHNPYGNAANLPAGPAHFYQPLAKKCAICTGKGVMGFSVCKCCNGIGSVIVENELNCGKCNGKGVLGFSVCNTCKGSGWRNVVENPEFAPNCCSKVECKLCNGKGTVGFVNQVNCKSCKGSGDVLVMNQKVACAICNNKGQIGFSSCKACKGCGWGFSLN